jgi:glycerol-3-phosphate acyltransferase PlsY
MWELGVKTLLAYLLGTLLGSLVLGRLRGVDIRSQGSGNAGATNAMRTQGMVFGLVVLLIDVLKGAVAAAWLPFAHLPGVVPDVDISREWLSLACGAAVILGHIYPVWFGFRGGKGVATVVGVVGALQPHLLLPLILSWFAVVLLTGYVGLASMLAGVTLVVTVYVQAAGMSPLLLFCLGVTLLVIYTHRGNVARMLAGTENRARRLWLFRPRAAS